MIIKDKPTFDPVLYKNKQRQQWNQVAVGWRRWWPLFERGAQGASEQLVEMAQLQPGQRVLDIATGVGEPALTAARRVGPTGQVIATDQAQQMLTIAQKNAPARLACPISSSMRWMRKYSTCPKVHLMRFSAVLG